MTKSVFGCVYTVVALSLLGVVGCYAKVEVSDSSADKAIAIDWVEPPCAEPGSAAGYIEGNGFGAENVTITVGGIEAEVLTATGKDASFVVPEELTPGPTEVLVTNPGGRIATINWVVCGFDCSGIDCDDGNECTIDTCDPAVEECVYTLVGDGAVCDFGGLPGVCIADVCEEDLCADVDCDDGDPCTTDSCNPLDGSCTHTNTCLDAMFMGVGDLPGGVFASVAWAVSADGNVVVGDSRSGQSGPASPEAFRWEDGLMVGLGHLPGGLNESRALAVSADGSVIVGRADIGTGEAGVYEEAFRWTESDGMVGLGDLPGGHVISAGRGVSADGSVIVGDSGIERGTEAFRWTASGGMEGIGHLDDLSGGNTSQAFGVSADGSVIVGAGTSVISGSRLQAFRWTESDGMVGLGSLGNFDSVATGASADGSVVVGRSRNALNNLEAFRWTESGGMVGLGDLPAGGFYSEAFAVSADGATVVGLGTAEVRQFPGNQTSAAAFIWDEPNGMQSLEDVLTVELGLDLGGWALLIATGISADGRTVVGYGNNPAGDFEGWIAYLGLPQQTWGTPVPIETSDEGDNWYPQLAVDADGNVTVVWHQSIPGVRGSTIWSNGYTAGIGWGAAEIVEYNADFALEQQVAVDPSGNATAVWRTLDESRTVWASRYTSSTGWSVAQPIGNAVTNTFGERPQLAVDPDGNVTVVWDSPGIRYNRYTPGSGWGEAGAIPNAASGTRPQLAVDPAGNVTVVWDQAGPGNEPNIREIWASRYTPGLGWVSAEPIDADGAGSLLPKVTVDAEGYATAMWAKSYTPGQGPSNVWCSRYEPGVAWGASEQIETDDTGSADAGETQVAAEPNGHVTAVWTKLSDGVGRIWSNRYIPGAGWGLPEPLSISTAEARAPQLAVDPGGNAMAVWYQYDGVVRNDIWASRYTPSDGWRTPELIETDMSTNRSTLNPQVAVDPAGHFTAVWMQGDDNDRWTIWSNRFE